MLPTDRRTDRHEDGDAHIFTAFHFWNQKTANGRLGNAVCCKFKYHGCDIPCKLEYYSADKIEKNKVEGACKTYGEEEWCIQGFGGET